MNLAGAQICNLSQKTDGRHCSSLEARAVALLFLQGRASLSDFLISLHLWNIRPEGYPGWGEIMGGAECLQFASEGFPSRLAIDSAT